MESLEMYCDFKLTSSEQHVDLTKRRIVKDTKHLESFLFWVQEHKPFKFREHIVSLSTGITGGCNDVLFLLGRF